MPTELKMPQLGESIHEGTISRWLKGPGERIERYEPLLEVVTDKITSEVSAPEAGILGDPLVGEGETVAVGTLLAVIYTSAAAAPPAEAPPEPAAAPRVSPLAQRVAQARGVDLTTVHGSGPRGQVTRDDVLRAASEPASPAATSVSTETLRPAARATFLSPRVQALAAHLGVDPRAVQGTGRDGRVTARDVERYAETTTRRVEGDRLKVEGGEREGDRLKAAEVEALAGDELLPLDAMRRSIAETMARSQRTAPHVTTVHEADVTRMVQFFNAQQDRFRQREGFALTYTPFFIQAVVRALQAFPQVNAVFTEQGIVRRKAVNIGMAVALADGGLLVPVLRDADEKTLVRLAREVVDLATRARAKRVTADELRGGTFTLTNYGVFGGLIGTPILNPPQAAILGVGAVKKRPVVVETEAGDSLAIRHMVYLSLTFDHRAFDGAVADQFTQRVVTELQAGTWSL